MLEPGALLPVDVLLFDKTCGFSLCHQNMRSVHTVLTFIPPSLRMDWLPSMDCFDSCRRIRVRVFQLSVRMCLTALPQHHYFCIFFMKNIHLLGGISVTSFQWHYLHSIFNLSSLIHSTFLEFYVFIYLGFVGLLQ